MKQILANQRSTTINLMYYLLKNTSIIVRFTTICIMFFALLSVADYDSQDPSLLKATGNLNINNICGKYGANIADVLIEILGYSVIIPIKFTLFVNIKLLLDKSNKVSLFKIFIVLLGTLFVATILSTLINNNELYEHGYGGLIGDYFRYIIIKYFFIPKSTLLVLLIIGCCLIITLYLNVLYKKSVKKKFSIISAINICIKKLFNAIYEIKPNNSSEILASNILNPHNISPKRYKHIFPTTDILKGKADNYNIKFSIDKNKFTNLKITLCSSLKDYGVKGEIVSHIVGPVVTLFEFKPCAGTKASKIMVLCDDIARSIRAISVRITSMPGKNTLGVEIPNDIRETIYLKELIETQEYKSDKNKLPLILGKSTRGSPIVKDLTIMPHLLIAGTTGSGKSVAINTIILSILYSCTIKQCRLIMIDPKILELSIYNGIPHLLSPVITEVKKAIDILEWIIREMQERYKIMSLLGVKNIVTFNALVSKNLQPMDNNFNNKTILKNIYNYKEKLPYIVIIIDEMADIMLVAGKKFETYIQRIVQMARASGIHLIMATQRPSVDIITGLIKANIPARISFSVTSKIDSKIIIGEQGAEKLLGMGDMLYMRPGSRITRIHSPFVSEEEVKNVVSQIKTN